MLFNSYEFIFLYLPIILFGFFWIAGISHQLAVLWLTAASLFFYGWWNPKYVLLLMASIGFNYTVAYAIGRARTGTFRAKSLLIFALATNLLLLAYFKYMNFFMTAINNTVGSEWELSDIVLPLGISFFTFTQIAFLIDTYRGIAKEYRFIHYILFITYFPHLIAGPILHHKQVIPQFAHPATYGFTPDNILEGLTIFTLGLAKKVLLADYFAAHASTAFDAASHGEMPNFSDSWTSALAYSFQIYFDFSGYSDMAIGLSRMFGVRLPANFNYPYKAPNIIEFWRRWHMTLSHFLRDYLYIPLGGNRKGKLRRYLNLTVTMVLGGLWHGANWTFVLWGALHGAYLIINHLWRELFFAHPSKTLAIPFGIGRMTSSTITFLAVVVAWIFFRADSVHTATLIFGGMTNLASEKLISRNLAIMLSTFVAVCLLPSPYAIIERLGESFRRHFDMLAPFLSATLFCICILQLGQKSEFIYFQF